MTSNYVGGMFGLFFSSEKKVSNFSQASSCDIELFKKFYNAMLKKGIYLAPSAYEAGFLSIAHSDEDITKTIETASSVFSSL
jgi:glutamate-1-semialdehyde 2,1-aminomutase